MVLPLKPPVVVLRQRNVDIAGSYIDRRYRVRQAKPYTLPTTYTRKMCHCTYAEKSGVYTSYGNAANACSTTEPRRALTHHLIMEGTEFQTEIAQAKNHAFGKLTSELGERSLMLVSFLERRKSMLMIASRARQLLGFANALRKGRIRQALFELKTPEARILAKRGWRPKAKDFAGQYSEAYFGWQPLMYDIANAIDVFQRPIPLGRITVRGRRIIADRDFNQYYYTSGILRERHWGKSKTKIYCTAGCSVHVDNPNLWLANQLGFTNLLGTAWDAIPFSFVVDWFFNVEQFLGSFTAFHGLTVIDPWHTIAGKGESDYNRWTSWPPLGQYGSMKIVRDMAYVYRQAGSLPSVTLRRLPPWDLSPRRALAAISLLIQTGLKGH